MTDGLTTTSRLKVGSMADWTMTTRHLYAAPFSDVRVDGHFVAPSGKTLTMPAFYNGNATWRLRFTPSEAGHWSFHVSTCPADPALQIAGTFVADPALSRGSLRLTPGKGWGFGFDDGTPYLPFGDTVYDLFGMDYCGGDVFSFLERRKVQGFDLFRVRFNCSPFHPPEGYSDWQTRNMWPWGGSPTLPCLDQFNLDWFRHIDQMMHRTSSMGLGLELIMEAWGFEFPFNHRALFTPEWEELWMR